MEVACKLAYGYWYHRGQPQRSEFIALQNAYHGDTIGAVSVGGIDLFHAIYRPLLFRTHFAPSPYCYRCPLGLQPESCRLACADRVDELIRQTRALALELNVVGLINIQYAIKDGEVYVLEVNPRASRTVPFVSKATGVPWAKIATKVMLGKSLDKVLGEYGLEDAPWPQHVSVKESVFPFNKFPGVDVILGPEMRSTGEVMGIDRSFGLAFAKSQMAAGVALPTEGTIFISVNDADKPLIVPIARELARMGFNLIATAGTRAVLAEAGIRAGLVPKIQEGRSPNMLHLIEAGSVQLLINTPTRRGRDTDEGRIRAAATIHNCPIITTITGAQAAVAAIRALREGDWQVRSLQDYFGWGSPAGR